MKRPRTYAENKTKLELTDLKLHHKPLPLQSVVRDMR